MSEFKRKRDRKLPEILRDDYILHGDADKVYNKITRENSSCSKKDMQDTLNTLNTELEKLSLEAKQYNGTELLNQLESMNLNDDFNGTKKRRMNGGMTGISATALIMYLIADALKEGAKYGYEQITQLLAGGLKVLEFLSNKDSCAELVLREYLGKKMMLFIQFYYIADMLNEVVDPLIAIIKLAALLPKLLPYVYKGISVSFVSAIGFLVYHFVNYYGEKLSNNVKGKVESLKTTLDALEKATSDDVVEKVISTSKDMVKKTNELITELTNESPVLTNEEQEQFKKAIKEGLTAIPEVHQGEFDDTMTIEELRATLKPEVAAEGGKKHKKRKTQKRKNKSNKKTIKKSNKSKKHHK